MRIRPGLNSGRYISETCFRFSNRFSFSKRLLNLQSAKKAMYSSIGKMYEFVNYEHTIMQLVPTRCLEGVQCVSIGDGNYVAKVSDAFTPSWLNGSEWMNFFANDELAAIEINSQVRDRPVEASLDIKCLVDRAIRIAESLNAVLMTTKEIIKQHGPCAGEYSKLMKGMFRRLNLFIFLQFQWRQLSSYQKIVGTLRLINCMKVHFGNFDDYLFLKWV